MSNNISRAVSGARRVVSIPWNPRALYMPPWAINAFIYITLMRSIAYGVELLVSVNNPVGPLMAFAAIFGLQIWGIIMLVGATLVIIGMLTRSSILVTVGVLISFVVWLGFGSALGIGVYHLLTGGRHVVAALATAATWLVYFSIQLKSISASGVKR